MPLDKKSSKRVTKRPAKRAGTSHKRVIKPPVDMEHPMASPLTKNVVKSSKRVEKMLLDIKQSEYQPLADIEPRVPQPLIDDPQIRRELKALGERILELEAQLRESEKRTQAMNAGARPTPAILYEKEQVGYAFSGNTLEPLQAETLRATKPGNALTTPLVASGQTIGQMQVEPPSGRAWTPEETNLANAVSQQVSLQIQNLQLLTTAERARAEAQAATRQFTHHNWESFMDGIHNGERIGYMYDQASVAPFAEPSPGQHDLQETIDVLDEHVGSLFLKSDPAHPLTEEDRAMVSAVARQVAQQVENLRLLADSSRARADAEEATRRLSRDSWQAYTQRTQTTLGYVYDSIQVTPLKEASNLNHANLVQPLTVRGETIGQLALANVGHITPEAAELAQAIAERVSAQLERLRLTEEIEKRAAELATVARVSTTASTVLDPDELLQSVVNLTKERFGLYHAHIYLANEAWETLLLASGAGEIGQAMVASQHTIPMNAERSIVARAARSRQAVIVNNVLAEPDHLPNPLLPDTRSEMAVPMIVGDKVLGVFDVQSDRVNNFTEEDANIYTTLTSQVGVALQNARLYAEQSATLTQLRELDRLKSSFLANMSHELRTPLNSILGFADVIIEELDGPLTVNMASDLKLIQKNGQHLLHLINDVLDMAKIDAGRMNLNPERFRIHDLLEEVTSITSTLASEKNLALFIEKDSDSSTEIFADRTRLRQVMINLVNNAMKFTEKGEISLRAVRRDDLINVRVRDTGVGIPPDKLEIVFQEFTQVDTSSTRKSGGTGLGLPISRRLIEMHGGRLWAESSGVNGEGSTFFVELPLEAVIVDPIEIEKVQK